MKTFKQYLIEADIAYHYGDLHYGSDTVLGRMSGRSTGHFGTGVYFLSKPMPNTGRDDRPIKKVDLSKYKLAKPKSKERAKQLHDALKIVNNLLHVEDPIEEQRLIKKASFELWLAIMPASEEQLQSIIKKAVEEVRAIYVDVSHTSQFAESASTLVMKRLGFDGIDVRHIPDFDNTDYGTVVYAKELSSSQITEAMNVSSMGRKLRTYLNVELPKWILSNYRRDYKLMPFYQFKLNPNIPNPNPQPGKELVKEWLEVWIKDKLVRFARESLIDAGIGDAAKNPFDHIRAVKFIDYSKNNPKDHAGGKWHLYDAYISINENLLTKLVVEIYNSLEDHFIDVGFELPTNLTISDLRVEDIIGEIADILVHEVTHVHQDVRANYKASGKSYLTNQKKYKKIMQQALDTPGRHDIYLSSPDEIEAFSQDTAHKILRAMDLEDEDVDYVIDSMEGAIKWLHSYDTHYNKFSKSTNYKEYTIFKRFLKKVYLELTARLDDVKKMKAKVEADKKAKEDYNLMLDLWLRDEGIL